MTSPERVFYPATGTTKLDVIGYYAEASTVMLPHVMGRPATRKRWTEGVDKTSFFVKDLEAGTKGWLTRVQIRHGSGRSSTRSSIPRPRPAAPGSGGVRSGPRPRRRARRMRGCRPGPAGTPRPARSTSRGRPQRQQGPSPVPMDHPISSAEDSEWARLAAEELQKVLPALVVSRMALSHSGPARCLRAAWCQDLQRLGKVYTHNIFVCQECALPEHSPGDAHANLG